MSQDVYVKDIAEIRYFSTSVTRFADDYICQLNRVRGETEEVYRNAQQCVSALEQKVHQAQSDKACAEQRLSDYLASFNNCNDDKNKRRPDPAVVRELEEQIRAAEERLKRARRALSEGTELMQLISSDIQVFSSVVQNAASRVADNAAGIVSTISRAVTRIEQYVYS